MTSSKRENEERCSAVEQHATGGPIYESEPLRERERERDRERDYEYDYDYDYDYDYYYDGDMGDHLPSKRARELLFKAGAAAVSTIRGCSLSNERVSATMQRFQD